jgi:hypothetical protein
MALKVYTDKEGYRRVYEVPANLVDDNMIKHGICLGPPDLSSLFTDEDQRRDLSNALCDLGVYDYESMNGQRAAVHGVLRTMFGSDNSKTILIGLITIYQQDFRGMEA